MSKFAYEVEYGAANSGGLVVYANRDKVAVETVCYEFNLNLVWRDSPTEQWEPYRD